MSYSTDDDLLTAFGEQELIQRTDEASPGSIDWLVVEAARAAATAEIDAYLSRYALPLSRVPPILVSVECDIIRHNLYKHMIVEVVEERYKNARRFLELVGAGKLDLFGSDGSEPASGSDSSVLLSDPETTFGRDTFKSW